MFKLIAIVILAIACTASAKPAPQFLAYSAPLVAAPFASSAVVSREYHGVSAPFITSPYTAAYSSPYVAAPAYAAYSAPLLI